MARISKKESETVRMEEKQEIIWNAGIYARLSVDSHSQKNESIETQIQIAKEYIEQSGCINLTDCYTDLGKTGTNFEREGFDRMMADIRRHKINCVVVKDFSRFGRNYIETGNYMEKIFPFFHVRFIAVSDGYDSHREQGANDALAVNLKNIVNELYARDCAEKVRAVKRAKLEQGCYIGGIPPYGYYAEWICGKKVLVPEEGTSDVVRKIYELFDCGNSITEIISYLYGQHIHRPKEYRSTGHIYCSNGEFLKQWSFTTISTILTNHVYIGALVQIREGEKAYRSKGKCDIEPEDVMIMEHTHEPVIGEDVFYRISTKLEEKKNVRKKEKKWNPLPEDMYKNLIFCGECGRKLKRTCTSHSKSYDVSVRTYFYGCPNNQRIDGLKCEGRFISQNMIGQIVLETIRKEFDLSGIRVKTFVNFNRTLAEQEERNFEKKKREIQELVQEADLEMSSLYVQYRSGKIDKEAFLNLKTDREMTKNSLIEELSRRQEDLQCTKKEADEMAQFIRCLWKGKENAVLDSQVLHSLIKRITVYKDRRVEIIFNFSKKQFERYKEACSR